MNKLKITESNVGFEPTLVQMIFILGHIEKLTKKWYNYSNLKERIGINYGLDLSNGKVL